MTEFVSFQYVVRVEDHNKRELLQEFIEAPGPAEAVRRMIAHSTNLFGKQPAVLDLVRGESYAIFPEKTESKLGNESIDAFMRAFVSEYKDPQAV